jgi:hypothetical protein
MFMSADEGFAQKLADAGLTLSGGTGTVYAEGGIVLFAPKGSALKVDAKLNDLRAALADRRVQRFAIAKPEQSHAAAPPCRLWRVSMRPLARRREASSRIRSRCHPR